MPVVCTSLSNPRCASGSQSQLYGRSKATGVGDMTGGRMAFLFQLGQAVDKRLPVSGWPLAVDQQPVVLRQIDNPYAIIEFARR